ncbi:hypothetical protein [Kineobactrum salinum]|uniref:UrcA family protein n=1 Tax=Kineobactrum salinum TaxID=2708301 RepID=A0A6C0TX46_9GAMM|nr:hypothetical protein [Kineobactrum salinum]QIB64346.1 hypothetical protein G3T16_01920 [Kineobactrum salinum]
MSVTLENPLTAAPRRAPLITLALAALALVAASPAVVACDQPAFSYQIPDGKSADEAAMAAAQQAVKSYVEAGESFISCLEQDGSVNSGNLARLRNSTIDDMEQIAAKFNRQLRQYRKAN